MRDALVHRGPDDCGTFDDARVSLAHRRLSIVDPAGGAQPLFNEDRSVILVANGEIYNHTELRRDLERRGHRFATGSDNESIVHAYEEYGHRSVEHLDGMFAFVLYDQRRRRLFGARDRLGQKPLYFTSKPHGTDEERVRFAFASEMKSLWAHPTLRAESRLSIDGLVTYLLHDYVAGVRSIDQNIQRLLPAHAFELSLAEGENAPLRVWPYWKLEIASDDSAPGIDAVTAGEAALERFSVAIEKRLMSDVPLGVFLSGGIDSSTLVGLLRERLPERNFQTFSVSFDDPSFDESAHARLVAKHFDTDHHERMFSAADLLSELPAVSEALDEPFADPSILPTSLLCRFARQRVTVALGGDGCDELWAGYGPFQAVAAANWYRRVVPLALHRRVIVPLARRLPVSDADMSLDFKVNRFLRGAHAPVDLRTAVWMGPFCLEQLARLLPDAGEALVPERAFAALRTSPTPINDKDGLSGALDFFQRLYLPDDILTKVDRAGMMHSLEVRSPYLDHHLVEFVNSLPAGWKLRRGKTKYLFKQAIARRQLLPREILARPKKGFGIPVARWIRHDLAAAFREALVEDWPKELDMFDRGEIRRLHDEHCRRAANHYKELWALFMLVHWARNYLAR